MAENAERKETNMNKLEELQTMHEVMLHMNNKDGLYDTPQSVYEYTQQFCPDIVNIPRVRKNNGLY